jgi:hypothetical protein
VRERHVPIPELDKTAITKNLYKTTREGKRRIVDTAVRILHRIPHVIGPMVIKTK